MTAGRASVKKGKTMERITCAELMGYLEKEPEKVMVLDIETTGFYAPADEVLSLAIIDGTGETLFEQGLRPKDARKIMESGLRYDTTMCIWAGGRLYGNQINAKMNA